MSPFLLTVETHCSRWQAVYKDNNNNVCVLCTHNTVNKHYYDKIFEQHKRIAL